MTLVSGDRSTGNAFIRLRFGIPTRSATPTRRGPDRRAAGPDGPPTDINTQGYYRVTQKRKRDAVRTLHRQVIDRTGNSAPAPSQTAYELRSVAAPFGNCIEPSNVRAGGGACPIRFQCSGCGFYRADPSYIPAIEDHVQALQADPETATAMEVDDFVLRNLTDQITSYQHVLDSMRTKLASFDS